MCLLFLYFQQTVAPGEYKLIIVNNRDELYHRPTKPAHFWPPGNQVIGGSDEEKGKEGGTWFAMNKNGKASCLLNILQPPEKVHAYMKGRGFLVNDFVQGNLSPESYLETLVNGSSEYNGFLLVAIDVYPACPLVSYYTNCTMDGVESLSPGIHAFGNSSPKHLWEKAVYGKKQFEDVINTWSKNQDKSQLINGFFTVLKNTTSYPVDEQIQAQGRGYPQYVLEKKNAIFYSIPEINYGTRSHTIILVDGANNVDYLESSMEEPINIKSHVNWVNVTEKFTLA